MSPLARQVNTSSTLINVQEDDTFTPCLYHEERREDSRLVRRAPPPRRVAAALVRVTLQTRPSLGR